MYTEQEYEQFEDSKKPDIVRMDISDTILMLCELSEYAKASDLLFYDQIQDKVLKVTGSLTDKGCFEQKLGDNAKTKLSNKARFMVESNLEASSAAFLFENLAVGNQFYGVIATAILERPSGYFRDNEILKAVTESEIGINGKFVEELGDLAPVIFLIKAYNSRNFEDKYIYESKFGIKESDVKRIIKDMQNIE